jgi:beta-N-acetylhexosaminidase
MSLIGDHLFVGISGTTLNATDIKILKEVKPAGILFLKRNLDHTLPYGDWLKKFSDLIDQIREITEREKLFLSIDHEGGQVQRTPSPITNFGPPAAYATKSSQVGRAQAIELKSIGINLSWAPLADINTNPKNPIIGKLDRAFDTTANGVIKAVTPYYKAFNSEGVLTCAKHFPGHGDTWSDSHLELPIVKLLESKARERELRPFKALIDNGISFIMTAHVMYSAIDSKNPATLSEHILTDILRGDLGYRKIIVADDLNMLAIKDKFSTPDGLIKSFNAGTDMFIVARHPDADKDETPLLLELQLQEAISSKKIKKITLEKSKARIESILKEVNMFTPQELSEELFKKHQQLATSIKLKR